MEEKKWIAKECERKGYKISKYKINKCKIKVLGNNIGRRKKYQERKKGIESLQKILQKYRKEKIRKEEIKIEEEKKEEIKREIVKKEKIKMEEGKREEVKKEEIKQKEVEREEIWKKEAEQKFWEVLTLFQNYPFYTAKGLKFTYYLKGNEMFVNRKDKSITRSTVSLAFDTAIRLQKSGKKITGPKKLGTFGASYLYPIFIRIGVIDWLAFQDELL